MRKNFIVLMIFSVLVFGVTGCAGASQVVNDVGDQIQNVTDKDNEYVLSVKNGYPEAIPQITYGQAFDNFFANPTWKYFKGENGEDVVEFTGLCSYMEKEVKARLQFLLSKDKGEFEQGALEFNDVPQSELITSMMVYKAFESYATEHKIDIDQNAESSLGGDEDLTDYSTESDSSDSEVQKNSSNSKTAKKTETGEADESDYSFDDEDDEVEYDDFDEEDYGTEESEYIFPESDSRYLKKKEIKEKSKAQRRLGRNEIYARHGRLFSDSSLQEYFDSTSWYAGYIEPDEFDESVLNKYEKANAKMIKEYE